MDNLGCRISNAHWFIDAYYIIKPGEFSLQNYWGDTCYPAMYLFNLIMFIIKARIY